MATAAAAPRTHKSMREESDRRIFDAAIEAFADRGYARTTLNQIGRASGFTGALISNRYGSKAGLVRAVFLHILRRLTPIGFEGETSEEWIDGDRSGAEQLGDFIDAYIQDAIDQPTRLRALYVLLGESLGGLDEINEEVTLVNRMFRDHIAGYIRLGQEQGELRADADADRAAVIVVGALRGVVSQLLAESDRFDPAPFAADLRHGLVTPLLER